MKTSTQGSERSPRPALPAVPAVLALTLASCGSGTGLVASIVGEEVHVDDPFSDDGPSSVPPAPGQFPNPQAPGSLLLFPFLREIGGFSRTYVTITNTHLDQPIRVELHLVDGQTCLAQPPVAISMTPGDTWTAIVGALNATAGIPTFGWAVATDAAGNAIAFDHLVGSAQEVFDNDETGEIKVGTNAFAFQCVRADGARTDLDGDGLRDLDGREYSPLPDSYVFPGIVSQDASTFFNDSLVVLSLAGPGTVTTYDVTVRNDVGAVFSAQNTIGCWSETPLSTLSGAFTQAFLAAQINDPAEIVGEGRETCWFSVSPTPAAVGGPQSGGIFAFVIHRTGGGDAASSVQMPVLMGRNGGATVQF